MAGMVTTMASTVATREIKRLRLELAYLNIGKRNTLITIKVAMAIKMVFMVNKYMAPPKYSKLPFASPKPAVHKGGIKAVAIATPKITDDIVPRFVRAIIRAREPKK